jgi:hypothetical protein
MSSAIFNTLRALEFLVRTHETRRDASNVTLVGERIEIDVFEDDHLEIPGFVATNPWKAERDC